MPNWITNELHLEGTEKDVKGLLDSIIVDRNNEQSVTFSNIVPMPESEKGNWSQWNIYNWGTKWDACETSIQHENLITFQTAWNTPYNFLLALSEQHPNVKIKVRYSDEDFGYNVGEFTLLETNTISETIPEGGSLEAYLLAIDIHYGDIEYWTKQHDEYIDAYDESMFGTRLVDIIYLNNIIPTSDDEDVKIPNHLFETLIKRAISDEEFEYADKLQKVLN